MSILNRFLILFLFLGTTSGCADGYPKHPSYAAFAKRMAEEHGFDPTELEQLFQDATRKKSILEAIARPAERVLNWGEYRKIFITEKRAAAGVEFWRRHQQVLEQAAEEFGVPPEIIVAIIGVETRYGGNMGSYRVIDALSTLGFDYPPRSKFFLSELEHFLLLAREQGFDPRELKGSYAGAMGMGQFIPSSYRAYAVDFDGDGRADIWGNESDAIGSVANYFRAHGWKTGDLIAERLEVEGPVDNSVTNQDLKPALNEAELADAGFKLPAGLNGTERVTAMKLEIDGEIEFWMGRHNFYVITRYNHSQLFAMAVFQLSEAIRLGMVPG